MGLGLVGFARESRLGLGLGLGHRGCLAYRLIQRDKVILPLTLFKKHIEPFVQNLFEKIVASIIIIIIIIMIAMITMIIIVMVIMNNEK